MVCFSKDDFRKLASLCMGKKYACELIRDNEIPGANFDYMERHVAKMEAEWVKALSDKLLRVADSDAKRVEITF